MNTRPLLILVVVAAVLTSWINPLGAAIVTCQFSGDRIGSLALLDPGFEDSDPFSGTLIYETSTPESSSPGQPLAITLSVDGAPSLSWTAPASYDGTYIQYGFDAGPSGAVDIIGFKKGGTPALAAFNDFVVTSLRVEFYFEYDTLPSDLSDFDPLSPHIVERLLLVNFRHSNEEMESFYSAPSITEFSVVPEPSALALAACAAPGMAAVFRRRRTKRLVLPTAR